MPEIDSDYLKSTLENLQLLVLSADCYSMHDELYGCLAFKTFGKFAHLMYLGVDGEKQVC